MPTSDDERTKLGRIGLGTRIREVRERAGLRLVDVATQAGTSISYLSDLERGRRLPTLDALDAIARAMHTQVVTLLTGLYPWDSDEQPQDLRPPPDGRTKNH